MSRRAALPLALLGLAFVAAAFMRLYRPDLVRLEHDQVWHLQQAQLIATGEGFPAYGLGTTAGFTGPALPDYVLAPVLLLGTRLEPMTLYLGGLSLLGWLVTCVLLWRSFGPWSAVVGGSLYAASLWATFFARMVNGDTLIPLFNALLGWSVLEVLRRGSRAHLVLVPVWLSAAIQSHYAALTLVAPVALAGLLGRQRLRLAPLLAGIALGLALAGPWWTAEAPGGFPQLRTLLDVSGQRGDGPQLEAWTLAQHLTRISDLGPSMGHPWGNVLFSESRWTLRLRELQNLLLLPSLGLLLFRAARPDASHDRRRSWLWLTGWYLIPPTLTAFSPVQVQAHGLTVVYPAAYVVLGAAGGIVAEVMRRRPTWHRAVVGAAGVSLVGGVCLLQLTAWPRFLGWLDEVGSPLVGLMWSGWVSAEREVLPHLEKGEPLVLALPDNLREAAQWVFADDAEPKLLDAEHHLAVATDGDLIYLTDGSEEALIELLRTVGAEHLESLPYALGRRSLELYRVGDRARAWLTATPGFRELDWRLANGVDLMAYQADVTPEGLAVRLVWRRGAGPRLEPHSFFFHLVGDDGETGAKADFAAPVLHEWSDTVFVSHATLPPPEGTRRWSLSLGMYTWPDVARVRGGASGDAPEAPELRIPLD